MDIAEFLTIYQRYPCLWDKSHVDFKDRAKRNEAEAEILKVTEFADVKELRTKIKNIRGTYNQEVNKIKASIESGLPEHRPKLSWFKIADSFLRKNFDFREYTEGDNTLNFNQDDVYQTLYISDVDSKPPDFTLRNVTTNSHKVLKKKKRSEVQDLSKLYSSLNDTVRIFQRIGEQESNEYSCFAKWVSTQLCSLPQHESVRVQQEICNIIFNARLRNLDEITILDNSEPLSPEEIH